MDIHSSGIFNSLKTPVVPTGVLKIIAPMERYAFVLSYAYRTICNKKIPKLGIAIVPGC